jgi:ABC-type spermidine/putrescine transport system permease subunit I
MAGFTLYRMDDYLYCCAYVPCTVLQRQSRRKTGWRLTADHFQKVYRSYIYQCFNKIHGPGTGSTLICLLLGYPMAAILASREYSRKKIMYMLIVLPMWMNFLLRTYAWLTLLGEKRCNQHCFVMLACLPWIFCIPTRQWCWAWFTTSCPL